MKTVVLFTCLFCALLFSPALLAQENPAQDTIVVEIDKQLEFYQEQLKQNEDLIRKLNDELEQRKQLNQRLTGAITAATEIKKVIQAKAKEKESE